jgi:hypothetical protein
MKWYSSSRVNTALVLRSQPYNADYGYKWASDYVVVYLNSGKFTIAKYVQYTTEIYNRIYTRQGKWYNKDDKQLQVNYWLHIIKF